MSLVKKTVIVILILLTLLPLSLLAIKANFEYTRVCVGTQTMLFSTSIPTDSIIKVMWDLDGDGVFNDDEGEIIFKEFSTAGTYNVGLKVIDANGEQDAIYKSVPVASIQIAFSQDGSCRNTPVYFHSDPLIIEDILYKYTWDFGDGSMDSSRQDPIHNYTVSGEYTVRLSMKTLYAGCTDTVESIISIHNPPIVTILFSGDTIFPYGDTLIATVIGFDSLLWSNGDTTTSISITETGDYHVQAFLDGCYGEKFFSVTAVVDHNVRIMTVITPNSDGYNDRWEIININEIEPCQVEIYNRWGQKVFSANPYNNDWDGTYNGRPLSSDTYYYFLRCKDERLQTGTINIVNSKYD